MTADPRVDAYIADAAEFARPILTEVRRTLHGAFADLDETIKWSMPTFLYHGKNLVSMAAFKAHAAVIVHGDGRQGDAMGQWGRLRSLADLPPPEALVAQLRDAAARIDDRGTALKKKPEGARRPSKPDLVVPEDLAKALDDNPQAASFFAGLAPSHRREYVEWLTDARRAETRERRLLQAITMLAEGRKRYWKQDTC